MANTVAFFNGKGGCGKTTSIFHITGVLAEKYQKKVLVIDLDKQRNTSDSLLMENDDYLEECEKKTIKTVFDYLTGNAGLNEVVKKAYFRSRGNALPKYYNVDVLPSDVRLEDERKLRKVDIQEDINGFINENGYDWVLVDMPPSNKALNEICFSQIVNNVIVPFSSDVYSVSGYDDLMDIINKAREVNSNLNILGIYLARYMENCAVDQYIKEQLEEFGDMFINIQIPLMADLREAVMFGRPISFYKKTSKSRVAYENLTEYMKNKIEQMSDF